MQEPTEREAWLAHYLSFVPELLEYMRESVSPLRSSWPSGMPRNPSPDPVAPIALDAADEAEDLWQHLMIFVELVEKRTGESKPYLGTTDYSAWPAYAVSVVAGVLVRWLNTCLYRIAHDSFFEEYFEESSSYENLVTVVRRARARFQLEDRPIRTYHTAACPTCLEYSVRPRFDDADNLVYVCEECEDRWSRDEWHQLRQGERGG